MYLEASGALTTVFHAFATFLLATDVLMLLEALQAFLEVVGDLNALLPGKFELACNGPLLKTALRLVSLHLNADHDSADREEDDKGANRDQDPVLNSNPRFAFKPAYFGVSLRLILVRQQAAAAFEFSDEELSGFERAEVGEDVLSNICFQTDLVTSCQDILENGVPLFFSNIHLLVAIDTGVFYFNLNGVQLLN